MSTLIGIALGVANVVALNLTLNLIGWPVLVVYFGGLALLVLSAISYHFLRSAVERRADRKTVERLLALEPRTSWSEWALPAPESCALLRGVKHGKGDAFKLGVIQLIAMDVLEPEGGGGDTTLRRGPAPAEALVGSLSPIYRLWAASTEGQAAEAKDHVTSTAGYAAAPFAPSPGAHEITQRVRQIERRARHERAHLS